MIMRCKMVKGKEWAQRRINCADKIDEAIACLSKRNKDERKMIKDLDDIRRGIDNTIVYYLK